jgi:uncharacterized protein
MLLDLVTPHRQLERLGDLSAADLRERGIESLLVDLDGTLKDHYAAALDQEAAAWVRAIRAEGIQLCIVSNGAGPYVERFARQLDVPFIGRACKPLTGGCRKIIDRLGLDPARTAIVGDQLFTDILVGRWLGICAIAVRSINTAEPWHTRLKRPLERWILGRARRCAEAPLPLAK